jgi:hypothetical protein
MHRFAHHTTDQSTQTRAHVSLRHRFTSYAAWALVALSILGSALLPSGRVQAAGLPDLDVVSCYTVDDPVNYGDGVDWYKLQVTYKNKGATASGSFQYLVRPSWGYDLFSGQLGNEAYVIHNASSLQPGQSVSTFFWVTKSVVDKRTWGIFLDNNGFNHGTVTEANEANNHCTAFVNPS